MKQNRLVSIIIIVACVVVALAVKTKFERFTIPQNGMFPNFPAGTTHWVTKNTYGSIDDVALGDVVLFRRDIDGASYNFVWRVIARPGDEVLVEEDKVIINGEPLRHELLRSNGPMEIYVERHGGKEYQVAYDSDSPRKNRMGASLIVPDGHFFLLGDNRFNAKDSRYDGPVPFGSIFGEL